MQVSALFVRDDMADDEGTPRHMGAEAEPLLAPSPAPSPPAAAADAGSADASWWRRFIGTGTLPGGAAAPPSGQRSDSPAAAAGAAGAGRAASSSGVAEWASASFIATSSLFTDMMGASGSDSDSDSDGGGDAEVGEGVGVGVGGRVRALVLPFGGADATARRGGGGDGSGTASGHLTRVSRSGGGGGGGGRRRRRALLVSLAATFVVFLFTVAALMLLMAGVGTCTNSVVVLCAACVRLGVASLVLGAVLLLSSLLAFVCLQQRIVLGLLLYTATAALSLLATSALLVVGGAVVSRNARFPTTTDGAYMLRAWERAVNETYLPRGRGRRPGEWPTPPLVPGEMEGEDDGEHRVCRAQREFNCSGFLFGCCLRGVCYHDDDDSSDDSSCGSQRGGGEGNISSSSSSVSLYVLSPDGGVAAPPPWVRRVCPQCPGAAPPAASVCTAEVYSTVRRNVGGFLAMAAYAWLLMACGCAVAVLARRAAVQRRRRRRQRLIGTVR